MAKGKALNFTIPDELYEEIKEEAESKNISMASVVRIALSEYLKKEQKK
jgi:predicted DNA-binding ribbon-helix-helix protein